MPRKKKSEESKHVNESNADEQKSDSKQSIKEKEKLEDVDKEAQNSKVSESDSLTEQQAHAASSDNERRKTERRKGERRSGVDRRASSGRRKEDKEKQEEPQPKPSKPDILHRIVAKLIDLFIFAAFYKLLDEVGGGMGLLYLAICDGVRNGASVGKWIIGLRVRTEAGKIAQIKDSILRNLTVVFAMGLLIIPAIGWILFLTLGLLVLAIETYFVFHDTRGLRIGDIVANTWVEEIRRDEN